MEKRVFFYSSFCKRLLPARNNAIWYALGVFALMLVLVVQSLQPPTALGADAANDVFSGERASQTLGYLLGNESPHPVGSEANRAVRDRLIESLKQLGLKAQIQRTLGCSSKWPICANVENVLAVIPGESDDILLLMAHYDSVPHAPGAADDGSGVAALLESARILVREPRQRNRILLLFTDAEEMGLLGAEGFFGDHPLVKHVKAVINLEGAGSGGPSLLLRSSDHAGHLLNAVRETSTSPIANSYAQEVFARIPNDTDFSVPNRAGIPGLDFSFAFEFNHYHTPLDSLENLDRRSLQHHGDYLLPLTRQLAGVDLNKHAPNFAYLTIQQTFWITWPTHWTVGLAVTGLLGLLIVNIQVRENVSISSTLAAIGFSLLVIITGTLTCLGLLWIGGWLAGTTVSFPASPWPWRMLLGIGALLPVAILSWRLKDRLNFWSRYLGLWWLLGLLALALAVYAPLAANLLIVPLLIASGLALLAVLALDSKSTTVKMTIGIIAAAALAYQMLRMSYAMEQTQGLLLAPAIYAGLILLATSLLPFKADGRFVGGLVMTALIAWTWVLFAPLYSEWRPQHLSLYYVLDHDEDEAQWVAVSNNPLPDRLVDAFGVAPVHRPLVPWSTARQFPSFDASLVELPKPETYVQRVGENVTVSYRSHTGGDYVQLLIPEVAGVSDLTVAGHAVPVVARAGFVEAWIYAVGTDEVEFRFRVATAAPIQGYIVDGSHSLPEIAQPYLVARGTLAVPQHQGDQRLAFSRLQL